MRFGNGELARRIPLKRTWLAKLITAIDAADPRAIVLDLDLRQPNSPGRPSTDYDEQTGHLLDAVQAVADHHPMILPRSLDVGADGELHEQKDIFEGPDFAEGVKNFHRGYIQLPYDLRTVPLCWSFAWGLSRLTGIRHAARYVS